MSEIKRRTEENIEDVERVSNILNRRIKKDKKNPFLNPDGGFDLIEKSPVYESKRKRKKEGD
ncbi:hypothetical protein ES703_121111 [subsurface metagenome]